MAADTPPDTLTDPLNAQLVDRLVAGGVLRSPQIERAFRHVPRHHFLPTVPLARAYEDEAIATHFQENSDEWISSSSQPTMMAIMLEQLKVRPGMRVLEIGAGTGYNAGLLANLTENPDLVWTVDVTPEFCDEARAHLAAANQAGVHVLCADGWLGWPEAAPYDRLIVTAGTYDIAPAWFSQLRAGGIMVLPWGVPHRPQRSVAFRKTDDHLVQQSSRRCFFMALRGRHEWAVLPAAEQTDSWEQPWMMSPPLGPVNLEDLAFFLSLFLWPLVALPLEPAEAGQNKAAQLGVMDRRRQIVAQAAPDDRWRIRGQGDSQIASRLEELTLLWQQWGRPEPERLCLMAYPQGTAPAPQGHQRLARREWFDYLVALR